MKTEWIGGDAVDWLDDEEESKFSLREKMSQEEKARARVERDALTAEILEMERTRGEGMSLDQALELHNRISVAYADIFAAIRRFETDKSEKTPRGLEWYRRTQKAAILYRQAEKKSKTVVNVIRETEFQKKAKEKREKDLADKMAKMDEIQRKAMERKLLKKLSANNILDKLSTRNESPEKTNFRHALNIVVIDMIQERGLLPNDVVKGLFAEAKEIVKQYSDGVESSPGNHDGSGAS